jgi:hypothetical protein
MKLMHPNGTGRSKEKEFRRQLIDLIQEEEEEEEKISNYIIQMLIFI